MDGEASPCGFCGVRPDVACKHRPAYRPPLVAQVSKPDSRKVDRNQGRAFVGRHRTWCKGKWSNV